MCADPLPQPSPFSKLTLNSLPQPSPRPTQVSKTQRHVQYFNLSAVLLASHFRNSTCSKVLTPPLNIDHLSYFLFLFSFSFHFLSSFFFCFVFWLRKRIIPCHVANKINKYHILRSYSKTIQVMLYFSNLNFEFNFQMLNRCTTSYGCLTHCYMWYNL